MRTLRDEGPKRFDWMSDARYRWKESFVLPHVPRFPGIRKLEKSPQPLPHAQHSSQEPV
jgi:hypothetical protein